jgi:hypothetical protein
MPQKICPIFSIYQLSGFIHMDNQGVFVTWLDDGAIVVFPTLTVNHASVDRWTDFIMTVAAERPSDIAFIHGLSLPTFVLEKIEGLNGESDPGYVAVLLAPPVLPLMISFLENEDIEQEDLLDHDLAFEWIQVAQAPVAVIE